MSDGLDRSKMGVEGLKLEEGFTCAGRNIPVVGLFVVRVGPREPLIARELVTPNVPSNNHLAKPVSSCDSPDQWPTLEHNACMGSRYRISESQRSALNR